MPDLYGIVPTIFSVASSMTQYWLGNEPMMSVPLPATIFGGAAAFCAATSAADATSATPMTNANVLITAILATGR